MARLVHCVPMITTAPAIKTNPPMKVLLQDCKTKKFMRVDSLWTENINLALDFLSVMRAVSYGLKELKDSFNIVQLGPDDLLGIPKILPIPMENLNVSSLAGVTRYAISAGIIESSVQLTIV